MTRSLALPKQSFSDAVERVFESRFPCLQRLLSTPSANYPPHGDELESQKLLAEWISELGVEPHLFTPLDVPKITENPFFNADTRDYSNRPNVVAKWPGRRNGRSLLLTTHVDVVGVGDHNNWMYPPFSATEVDGHLYGRGTVDVKSGLAALLMAIETVVHELKIPLRGDVIFASVVDEEFGGMNGSLAVVAAGYRADGCLLVEPTELDVCPAAPGGQQYFLAVLGKSAYEGNSHEGVCAIGKFLKVYQVLRDLEVQRNVRGRTLPMFVNYPLPFPITVSTVEAGDAAIGGIADRCRSFVWHSAMPGESREQLLGELRAALDRLADSDPWLRQHPPEIELVGSYLDPCQTPSDDAFVQCAASVAGEVLGREVRPTGLRAACDLSRFVLAGQMPSVVVGPGDPTLAHTTDEKVSIEELKTFMRIVSRLIMRWCR